MTNQNEVLAILRDIVADNRQYTTWTVSTPHLVMLWEKAQELEREANAKMVDHILKEGGGTWGDAIRARGQA